MIYLLRHGEIDLQGEKRFVGHIDLPLTGAGIRQAESWREKLSSIVFDGIFCSDLSRSFETARIIAGNRNDRVQAMSQLREIDLGAWDGVAMSEIRERFPDQWQQRGEKIASFRPPRGESFTDLFERVVPVFEEIARQSKASALIVGHAGVNRMILCHVLGLPLAGLFRLEQDYGALNLIDCRKNPMRLKAMNMVWRDWK
jgi:alpha-ribazole phosphatase